MKAAPVRKALAPPPDPVEFFYDIVQGTPEWHELRRGLPTASVFSAIMANGKDGGESAMRRKLLYQMAGEELSGEVAETFQNDSMRRGNAMEPEARERYMREIGFADVREVGFVRRTITNQLGRAFMIGCSPDLCVGADGAAEFKTMRPDLLIDVALKGAAGFPTEHRAQLQGTLLVTGFKWVDLMLFYRGMPIAPRFHVMRDEPYIARLASELERFDYELRALVAKVRGLAKAKE